MTQKQENERRATTEYNLHTATLNSSTLQDGANTCTYTKSKEKPPSKTRVADRSVDQMWRGTWKIGQAHKTEGSYPRPRGATVGRSRCLVAAPRLRVLGVVGELSPAFSALARVTQPAPRLGRGTDGVTGAFSAQMLGMGKGGIDDARYGEGC